MSIHLLRIPDGLEMFDSIRHGLGWLLRDPAWAAVTIHPVDHPLVRAGTICSLVGRAGTLEGTSRAAIVPVHEGRLGHPVLLARRVAEEIGSGELAGPRLREVLAAIEVLELPVEDGGVRTNLNRPEDMDGAST